MNLAKKLLSKLNGLHYRQDYLCFGAESFTQPLYAYLIEDSRVKKDISTLHAFVGYCPVIFVLPAFEEINEKESIEVALTAFIRNPEEPLKRNGATAFLRLKKIAEQKTKTGLLLYFEGAEGHHRFTTAFHQAVGQLYNRLYNQKPGNVFLDGNLYKQVQIAYALPRKICLITVGINGAFNLFPTDLHGQVDDNHYVISLRHAGKACSQVTTARKVLLSDMKSSAYRNVYGFGKNHMQSLKGLSAFPFSEVLSSTFQLPLPTNAVAYKELQLLQSFEVGIHKLLLFQIVHAQKLTDEPETLVHVHNAYATWRRKKGLPGNYLLR